MRRGSLTIVGTGIKFGPQTTPEARAAIEHADEVLHLLVGRGASKWVGRLNRQAKTLFATYQRGHREGKERVAIYHDMVEDILERVRAGVALCVVFYGHPGVFVTPAHEAIRRAREEGFRATMLPGVSAEDCLFADLGIDPLEGWQSYEATRFLILPRKFDTSTPLVLWQLSGLGRLGVVDRLPGRSTLKVLVDYLARFYGRRHPVVLYEASHTRRGKPQIRHLPLSALLDVNLDGLPTLFVPPKAPIAPDLRMLDRLKIPRERVGAATPRSGRRHSHSHSKVKG